MKKRGRKNEPLQVNAVFDIETQDWSKYVLGALLNENGDYFETRDEEELFTRILQSSGQVWAHNGGRFDFLWFLDLAHRRGISCRINLAGSRITSIFCEALQLRDSAALVPMSLASFAELSGQKKSEVGFPCECGQACGGYCAIRKDMSDSRYRTLGDYLQQDCVCLFDSLHTLLEYAKEHRIELTGTIGGSAWKTAQTELDLPSADWTLTDYRYARLGYYGGRTQVFRPLALHGYRYDINSAYPAALSKTRIPIGKRRYEGRGASLCYRRGAPGIYQARFRVPDMFIPPLPYRLKDRIAYPVGMVDGYWTGLEMEAAEEAGAKIEKIHTAMVWEDSAPLLAPFVRRVWDLRAKEGKSTAKGKWLKWLANSLTGKFAQHPEAESAVINPDPADIVLCEAPLDCHGIACGSDCCVHRCIGRCRRWKPLGNSIWTIPQIRLAQCAHVQWSAYLTAATRIELRAQLIGDGDGKTALYCDTDSVYASTERTRRIGDGLGEWLCEGELVGWRAIAPKAYAYDIPDGKRVIRCKGLSDMTPTQFDKFLLGHKVEMRRGVRTFKSAARKGLFSRKEIARSNLSDGINFGDRILQGELTYPLTVDKLNVCRTTKH